MCRLTNVGSFMSLLPSIPVATTAFYTAPPGLHHFTLQRAQSSPILLDEPLIAKAPRSVERPKSANDWAVGRYSCGYQARTMVGQYTTMVGQYYPTTQIFRNTFNLKVVQHVAMDKERRRNLTHKQAQTILRQNSSDPQLLDVLFSTLTPGCVLQHTNGLFGAIMTFRRPIRSHLAIAEESKRQETHTHRDL